MSPDEAGARRGYRLLLRAYPRAHRARYGREMEDAFVALLRLDRARHGPAGAARCWVGAAWDSVVGGLAARAMRGKPPSHAGGDMLETSVADVRYALRSLRRRPVFALTAIATIALGIGANTSVFAIVDGFLLRPLPYEDPGALVAIWSEMPSLGWSRTDVNPADAWEWRARAHTLADLAIVDEDSYNLTGGDRPELVAGVRVTPNFLSVVGRAPSLGRDFLSDEVGEERDRVAILTDGFWARRFGRAPEALGSTISLDGDPVVVVGVLPPDYVFHDDQPDLLRPWGLDPADAPRDGHYAEAVARLADGVGIDAARDELARIAEDLASEHPENAGWTVSVVDLHRDAVGDLASQASVVLLGAVGFVLLMACVNVANLLLARAGGRTREISVRIALGAGRARVVRQLLTESLVLALAGGLLGWLLALWGYRGIARAMPPLPAFVRFGMDGGVLAFTAAITLAAAVIFGLVPALRASGERSDALRDGGRTGRSRGGERLGSALVVLQTSLAVVLLVGGGLLMKSLSAMRNQDFGFDATGVLTARVALPETEYPSAEASAAYWSDVTERLRALPAVVAAGTTQSHPLAGSNWGLTVRVAGQDTPDGEGRSVRLTYASPGLFEALGFRLLRGRVFDPSDEGSVPTVAIVNGAFAERYLGPEDDPLATTLTSGDLSLSIVGLVHDVVERGVDRPSEPALYVPIPPEIRARSLVVKTSGSPGDIAPDVQAAVWAIDPDLPVSGVETMQAIVERRIGGFTIIGYLMGVFALISLALGGVGIYGVTAHTSGQRRSEIGVRLAMGAERRDVVRMVVREGALRSAIGLALGLGLALVTGGLMSGILVGVSPRDPTTFVTVGLVLAGVSLLGLWIPARRASRVDPVRALASD